ncbi:MAG: cytochrome c-type biogenesis protein CcmH [Proteobacteria bacterium]|nr:cytochrome c-type biogenesis protein CcmH [Pseudomonadota bacterium]
MRRFLMLMIVLSSLSYSSKVFSVQPDEMLSDPVLELRAREISQKIRCLVCQNQPIDDSDADLAHDLRILVRERLVAGDTNDQIMKYLADRYGDYVLLSPPFKVTTLVLWLGPLFFLLGGGWVMASFYRNRKNGVPRPRARKADW